MPDLYAQADEALRALEGLEDQARENARRDAEPEPQAETLAERLAATRSRWVHFDLGSAA
jgi:hypothetical protein